MIPNCKRIDKQISSRYNLLVGQNIAENTDLDNLITPGMYNSSSASVSATLINTPWNKTAFRMVVEYINNTSRIRQTIYANSDTSATFVRTFSASETWGDWKQIVLINDTGSNSNGEYIKYEDGTMICSKSITLNNFQINTALGTIYTSNLLSLGNFAQEFKEVPRVSAQIYSTTTGYNVWVSSIHNLSKTYAGDVYIVSGYTGSSNTYSSRVSVIGYGKWK